jgi:hypothetical protein
MHETKLNRTKVNTHKSDEVCEDSVNLGSGGGVTRDIGLGDGELLSGFTISIKPSCQRYKLGIANTQVIMVSTCHHRGYDGATIYGLVGQCLGHR